MLKKSLESALAYHNKHFGRISDYDIYENLQNGTPIEEAYPRLKSLLQAIGRAPRGESRLAAFQVKGTSFRPVRELDRLRHHIECGGAITWGTRREPDNRHDPNAVAVYASQGEDPNPNHVLTQEVMVGYLPKEIAAAMPNYSIHIAGHLNIEEMGRIRHDGDDGTAYSIRLLCSFAPNLNNATAPIHEEVPERTFR